FPPSRNLRESRAFSAPPSAERVRRCWCFSTRKFHRRRRDRESLPTSPSAGLRPNSFSPGSRFTVDATEPIGRNIIPRPQKDSSKDRSKDSLTNTKSDRARHGPTFSSESGRPSPASGPVATAPPLAFQRLPPSSFLLSRALAPAANALPTKAVLLLQDRSSGTCGNNVPPAAGPSPRGAESSLLGNGIRSRREHLFPIAR